jgi:hypothetical protein
MKRNKKIIKFLKSVRKYKSISKYGESLEKLFKKNCVKGLIKSLNKQKIFTPEIILDSKLEKKEPEKIYDNQDEENQNQKSLLDYNYKDYLKRKKEIKNKIIKTKKEPWSINDRTPRLPMPKISFDLFKYNPNYDYIYKRVPSYTFDKSPIKRKIFNKDIAIKPEINLKTVNIKASRNNKNINVNINKNFFHTQVNIKVNKKHLPLFNSISCNSNLDINNKNKNKIQKIDRNSNEEIKLQKTYDKNNHCFRFTDYSTRKPITLKRLNDKVSYIEPYDYLQTKNILVNYKKMISRNVRNSMYSYDSNSPSMLKYSPKYDYIEPEQKKICFDPNTFRQTKKYKKNKIMKKILTSYDVSKDYLSIDNSKLGDSDYYSNLVQKL